MDTPKDIIDLIEKKAIVKQEVYANTQLQFNLLKKTIKKAVQEYSKLIQQKDERVEVSYVSREKFDAKLKIGGDTILFHMHTNVFGFDDKHQIWKKSYVKKEPSMAYCGMINVYNFLSDSFKFNRTRDAGYLVARIFINKENHFFVEGKQRLGFVFNDFANDVFDEKKMRKVIDNIIVFALNFELQTPPFDSMAQISISQISELTNNSKLTTDKRLGFKFKSEQEDIK